MKRSAKETAVLLAVILKRSRQTRARISAKTIKLLAVRQNLRSAFVVEIIDALAELDWILFEIASGGYGAVQAKALEAAKTVTAKRLFSDEERLRLREERLRIRRDNQQFQAFELEAQPEQHEPNDDDD